MAAQEFWINEQKRKNGETIGALEKSDHTIYFSEDEAQRAINESPVAQYRKPQCMIALTYEEWREENPEPVGEMCGTCRYSTPYDGSDVVCRRYPPNLVMLGAKATPMQPVMVPQAWCGEWKKKGMA